MLKKQFLILLTVIKRNLFFKGSNRCFSEWSTFLFTEERTILRNLRSVPDELTLRDVDLVPYSFQGERLEIGFTLAEVHSPEEEVHISGNLKLSVLVMDARIRLKEENEMDSFPTSTDGSSELT